MKLLQLGLTQPEQRDLSPSTPVPGNWQMLFGGGAGSDSGEAVNSVSAMQTAALNSCVRLISESIASMSPILYEKTGNGRQEAFNHPLHDLLSLQPNDDCSAFTLWDSFASSIALTGNGYLEITRNSQNGVTGLWFLNPQTVTPFRQASGQLAYRTSEGLAPGQTKVLKATDVIHVPWFSLNGVTGLSVIEQARNAIGSSLAMDKYSARFFANNSTPNLVLSIEAKMKADDKQKTRADFESLQSGSNQHRVAVLDQGMKITPIGISNKDAEWLSSRNFTREEICGLFRLHPSQIGSEARVAGETYAAQQLTFLTDTLRPWLNRIQQQLTIKLLPKSQNLGGKYSIAHDVSDRLKVDFKTQMDGYAVGRQWGFYTANDVRKALGENPGPAECDVYLTPANMVDAKKLLLPEVTPTQVTVNE